MERHGIDKDIDMNSVRVLWIELVEHVVDHHAGHRARIFFEHNPRPLDNQIDLGKRPVDPGCRLRHRGTGGNRSQRLQDGRRGSTDRADAAATPSMLDKIEFVIRNKGMEMPLRRI